MISRYALINESNLICVNIIIWDGNNNPLEGGYVPQSGKFTVESEDINIGDEVELIEGEYIKKIN